MTTTTPPTLTAADLSRAACQLDESGRGRRVLRALLDLLDGDGLGLDSENQQAVLTLLRGAWTQFPGTARDIMRDVLQR